MQTIYIAIDGIADGPIEKVEDDADILAVVQKKYPKAKTAERIEGTNVVIVSTKDD